MGLPKPLSGLASAPVWVAWADENGRKVPKSPHGGNARSNAPETWGTYEEALACAEANGYSGVGIMLCDGLTGIDLDDAIDEDGNIKPWAEEIIESIGSYAEISPSGRGIHVLVLADPVETGAIGRADHDAGIEVYNHGRYFTVTGEQIGGAPLSEATGEVMGLVEERFGGGGSEAYLRHEVRKAARDQAKRRANETMRRNGDRDDLLYARVPQGGETCGFCLMLASLGFYYSSEESAGGEGNHFHSSCRCKVIPGFPGMEVEGYDPDAYLDMYYDAASYGSYGLDTRQTVRNLDRVNADARNTRRRELYAQKKARAEQHKADEYEEKIKRAWNRFNKNKTPENYEATVGAALREIGEQFGISMTAEYKARPDGDEIWVALKAAKKSVSFIYATSEHKTPDCYIDGLLTEIKTPRSEGKIAKRLKGALEKFITYPEDTRNAIISLLRKPELSSVAYDLARDFVDDGSYDSVRVFEI